LRHKVPTRRFPWRANVLNLIKTVPNLVEEYEKKIAKNLNEGKKRRDNLEMELADSPLAGATLQKLKNTLRGRALKYLLPLARDTHVGYPELTQAKKLVDEIADDRLKEIDELAQNEPRDALLQLAATQRQFKHTSAGHRMALRLARKYLEKRNIQKTLSWLSKCPKTMKEASILEAKILKEGNQRIENAVAMASLGEIEKARKTLKEISKLYQGTWVQRRADRELKKAK